MHSYLKRIQLKSNEETKKKLYILLIQIVYGKSINMGSSYFINHLNI